MEANLKELTRYEGLIVKNLMKQRRTILNAGEFYRVTFETLQEMNAASLSSTDFLMISEILYLSAFKDAKAHTTDATSFIWSMRFQKACETVVGQYINKKQQAQNNQIKLF